MCADVCYPVRDHSEHSPHSLALVIGRHYSRGAFKMASIPVQHPVDESKRGAQWALAPAGHRFCLDD